MNFRDEVAFGSNRPAQAMPWISEIEQAKMATYFETLDSKKASGLMQNPESSERSLQQRRRHQQSTFLTGRHIAQVTLEHFRSRVRLIRPLEGSSS